MGYYVLFLVMDIVLVLAIWALLKEKLSLDVRSISIVTVSSLLLPIAVLALGMFSETYDTEIWNGKVVSKNQETVSCSHSYSCNCRQTCSGSGKDRSCSETCDTCYEHSHDYDWDVRSTVGTITIDRIDRQGVYEPPRFTSVQPSDPVSVKHHFTNYLKGAKNNVLNRQGTKITYPMPPYPGSIYDYYNIDRAISVDNAVPNLQLWSKAISRSLIDLGNAKQVNLVLVFTKQPEDYADQLNASWLGGKKNDVIVVIGTQGTKIDWVSVVSWTKREDFKVQVRDKLTGAPLDPASVVKVITDEISANFERRHMKEFEYLKYDIEPNIYYFIAAFISFFLPVIGLLLYNNRRKSYPYSNLTTKRRF